VEKIKTFGIEKLKLKQENQKCAICQFRDIPLESYKE
jgi:hypothetical protein